MAAQAPSAPRKLFREEAQTGAINCPSCGGPIELHGFGAVEQVNCPYCGSELAPQDSGDLQIVQAAQRARRESALPLHARGTFPAADGKSKPEEFEIIGIMWRECRVDGVVYPWQEFLLYNPYIGYRYLMFTMTDGSWAIGQTLDGAPQLETGMGHRKVSFAKEKFKHFQTSVAIVSYVEGEFPWQARVGDQAVTHDFVKPPFSMSIEEAATEAGQDVNFTKMRHIDGAEVWKAFKLPGQPPRSSGVAMIQPNPYQQGRALTWILLAVMLVAWLVASIVYVDGRSNEVIVSESNLAVTDTISEEVEIGTKGELTTVEFDFKASGLSNAWAYAEVMLISQESEDAVGFGATAEEWHGVSGGESWREGDQSPSVTVGKIPGGKYTLQITPSAGQQGAGSVAPAGLKLGYTLRQNVVLGRYIVLPFFIIFGFPIFFWLLGRLYEGRRWSNSDYVSSSDA